MNQEQYENFIAGLEREAEQNPARYHWKLGGMATLGYAYIAAMLLALFAIVVALGWMVIHRSGAVLALKLGIFVVPLIWAVLRAVFVTISPPAGREIAPRSAPALFEFVEEIRRAAGAPRVHHILMTGELNASVVQHPRLGIFGWSSNYLILGLPLMQALSLAEFRAVVAHEFGHLSGAHGKFGAWIYRLRTSWARLAGAFEDSDHWGRFMFVPFFKWYAPAFAAYSFVQARRQEYEADRVSAAATSPQAAGAALVRFQLQSRFLRENFWSDIFRQAQSIDRPQAQPFSSMRHALLQSKTDSAEKVLEAALKFRTGSDDTHPCLNDRLRALGVTPKVPAPFSRSAADSLLGPFRDELAAELDEEWHESIAGWWQGQHEAAAKARGRLDELDRAAAAGELSVDDAFERASLTEDIGDESQAFAQLEALFPRATDHAPTLCMLGRLKLARDDESGIELLEDVALINAAYLPPVGTMIVDYLRRHGRNEDMRPYMDRLAEADIREAAARKERSTLLISDKLLPHELPANLMPALLAHLADSGEVRRAWLARKQTRHRPEVPMYVLAIQRRSSWWKFESSGGSQQLIDQLARDIELPGDALVIPVDGENKSFGKKLGKMKGTLVYEDA